MIVGFNFTPLLFLLAKADVSVDRIAGIGAIVNFPGVLGLIIAPVVDIKLRRRTWLTIGMFGTVVAAYLYSR
jgi:MFS-type transporter involved in bile tolerance (Atg22 family)